MGFIKELKEAWRAQIDRKRKQESKYRIEYAFTCGGTKYYQFADINNLPYERGLMALDVYREVEMRCSRDFLDRYQKAMEEILHDGRKIDIYKLNSMNEMLKQRLAMATDVDLLYKLASVAFFDKTENPCVYDAQYAEKKIAKWRKDAKVADFFSQKPLKELMPFLAKQKIDLNTYSTISEEINKLHSSVFRMLI